jgi:hypothetical protein
VQLAASGIGRRHLRGRCGGSWFWRRRVSTHQTRRAVSRACHRQRRARQFEAAKEARAPRLQRHLPKKEGPRDEGPTAGRNTRHARQRGSRAGFSEVKSIRIAATTLPFAGDAETGISIGRRAEGTPTFRSTRRTDDEGCSNRVGGGDLTILPHGPRPRGWRRTFAPIGSAHTRNHSIASPTLGATDGGFPALPRTRRREERWSSSPHLSPVLHGRGAAAKGRVWLAARLPSEEGGPSHATSLERETWGAGANASVTGGDALPPSGRGSDARGRARAF